MNDFLGWAGGIFAALLSGFSGQPGYHGYVEADYVYVAAESAGRIVAIDVREGETIARGAALFALDDAAQQAALRAAEARRDAAEANWRNLETGGRAPEIAVIDASLDRARANQALARINYERSAMLNERGVLAPAKLDADKAALDSANAQVAELEAQKKVSELPARDAQQVAAEAQLQAAKADADQAAVALANRHVDAPTEGRVERVYFREGEIAGAGTPVLSILPPDRLKVKFYVPETERSGIAMGAVVHVTCDGCGPDITGHVTYLASDPQHTPPIIYSREERARLVFLAEARLEPGSELLPGQPVSAEIRK